MSKDITTWLRDKKVKVIDTSNRTLSILKQRAPNTYKLYIVTPRIYQESSDTTYVPPGPSGPSGPSCPVIPVYSGPTGPTGVTEACENIQITTLNNTLEVFVNLNGTVQTYTITIPVNYYTYDGLAQTLQNYICSNTGRYGMDSAVIYIENTYQIAINGTGYPETSSAGFQLSTNSILSTLGYTQNTYTSLVNQVSTFVPSDSPVETNCSESTGPSEFTGPSGPSGFIYTTLIVGEGGVVYGIPYDWDQSSENIIEMLRYPTTPTGIINVFNI